MRKRSSELEIMDLGPNFYTYNEYIECLNYLGKINDLLGGTRALINTLKKLPVTPKTILDFGCGGGWVTKQIALAFPNCRVTGIDTSEDAIKYAKNNTQETHHMNNLFFELAEQPELDGQVKSYDVIVSTLVCHHLTDDQIITFLKRSACIAKMAIIINDLHRSWLAYFGFKIISKVLYKNRLVMHDGLLSIKRSFVYSDLKSYLLRAGFAKDKYKISWYPLFRWIVLVELD